MKCPRGEGTQPRGVSGSHVKLAQGVDAEAAVLGEAMPAASLVRASLSGCPGLDDLGALMKQAIKDLSLAYDFGLPSRDDDVDTSFESPQFLLWIPHLVAIVI